MCLLQCLFLSPTLWRTAVECPFPWQPKRLGQLLLVHVSVSETFTCALLLFAITLSIFSGFFYSKWLSMRIYLRSKDSSKAVFLESAETRYAYSRKWYVLTAFCVQLNFINTIGYTGISFRIIEGVCQARKQRWGRTSPPMSLFRVRWKQRNNPSDPGMVSMTS